MTPRSEPATATQPRRVLLIEDSEFVHQLYRVAFRKLGKWEVHHTYNGEEGLRALPSVRPDLVIVDIQMPVMGGLEFLDKVALLPREQRPNHCLVASTEGSDDQIRDALKRGAQSFLKKPFTLEQFLELLGRITATLPSR